MAARSSNSALLPEGYEFVRMLGHGASGWVALARQVRLDRLVAIKAIHAGGLDRLGQRRLEREGRAVVALRHPGIVAAYELRQIASGAALVMEYVPGGAPRASMDSGTVSGSHAAALLGEMAERARSRTRRRHRSPRCETGQRAGSPPTGREGLAARRH